MAVIVDNLSESELKRRELIKQIQELHKTGFSIREIARITGRERKTVKKYLEGNPDKLCRSNKHGCLEGYKDFIIKSIQSGLTQSTIAKQLTTMGYTGTITNARQYIRTVADQFGLDISKYSNTHAKYDADGNAKPKVDYITRKGIFNYLWMNGELTREHHDYLWEHLPVLREIEQCIKEFREIFARKSMPLLYLYIERYKTSEIKEIASFAKGLENDIYAVENAVASNLSNGFVEGTNSKVKMVKRTMYGRCGKQLLSAKLMYRGTD